MELSASEIPPYQAQKKAKSPQKWKRNLEKIKRYSSKQSPKIVCGHNSKAYDCKSLNEQDIQHFHNTFYATKSKTYQDDFILKYCSTSSIQRRRPTKCERTSKIFQTKCFVPKIDNTRLVPVCQKSFLAVLSITRSRLNYVMKIFHEQGTTPVEKRGGDHCSHKYEMKKSAVSSFLSSLKCVESSELTINKLFKIYNENSPDELKVKPSYFRSIFNSKFNLEVQLPRAVVCSTCSELSEKIKTCLDKHLKQTFMAQKRIHTLKYKEFYKLLKDENPQILILSFDCQKKQVLPKVDAQAESNSRQLYFQNFTIVQGPSTTKLNGDNVFIYTWTENQFSKNANLITSALHHRLQNTRFNDDITTLRLIADGCAGQNKNAIIIAMLLKWFSKAPSSLKQIELIFPIVGHSFLPPHRVFANAEKQIKKIENILFPEEYEKILTEFGSVLKIIDVCPVQKWKDVSKEFLQPPRRWHFKFSTTNKFFLRKTNQGDVVITGEENYRTHVNQNNYRSICKKDFKLKNIQPGLMQPYSVKINSLKVRNIRNLMEKLFGQHWLNYDNLKFYANFVNNSQQQIVVADDTHEEYCT